MKFIADLHLHSKFSRATAKNLDLEHLYVSAQIKGVTVVGTGDFTHPAWFSEIREKLVPAEPGLFRLRQEIAEKWDMQVPESCRGTVRFVLQCEISNIYKKNGRTRKNHHLVFMPDMETVSRFNAKLEIIGNIKSDGRPILGLDAKELLRIMLETSEDAFLIPAHIWTPWFSVLGSKSGFDSLEECFEELFPEIFAAETGLSSDPPMNWRISELDRITLVSNSDSHSPANMGRNANIFDTELSYPAIRSALKSGDPAQCLGTLDMYPQEGKYHMDGHRKCHMCLHPTETIAENSICPVCGKPLTIGVLYRVEELADRPMGSRPDTALPFRHIIPLGEIMAEIFSVGVKTKKVGTNYQTAVETLGPEINILRTCATDVIDKAGIPLLGEAIRRMRAGEVHVSPGYDGEYGKITLFEPAEREKLLGQTSLFVMPASVPAKKRYVKKTDRAKEKKKSQRARKYTEKKDSSSQNSEIREKNPEFYEKKRTDLSDGLNEEQYEAVHHEGSPLLIVAGPGAGKTLTLTHRIAHIIRHRNISPENILAVTFTTKAAGEMRKRLGMLLEDSSCLPMTATFHALCFHILKHEENDIYSVIDEHGQKAFVSEAVRQLGQKGISVHLKPNVLGEMIVAAKQNISGPHDDYETAVPDVSEKNDSELFKAVYETYQALLDQEFCHDYEDLILKVVKLLESDSEIREKYRNRFQYVFVDEYQDLNQGQYRIVKALAPEDTELCVIGDPDQSIYGFRGSDVRYFQCFSDDYPNTRVISLNRNYRSTETILEASYQIIRHHSINSSGIRVYSDIGGFDTLTILEPATEKSEAVAVGMLIENMVGGTGFHSVDFGKTGETGMKTDMAFSDFAVLYRTKTQSRIFADVFGQAGIPYQIANREHICNRKGIAELLSLLRIMENMGTLNDFQKILGIMAPGVGRKTLDILMTWFYENRLTLQQALFSVRRIPIPGMKSSRQSRLCKAVNRFSEFRRRTEDSSVEEKLLFLLENTGLSAMISENSETGEALNVLLSTGKSFGMAACDFLETIVLRNNDTDAYDANAQKVALMTMHAAKGLEFPAVFITGCEKDFIPFRHPGNEKCDIDEERRLFYVAMTRARERLFLSHVKKRNVYGKFVQREISPFVKDIADRLMHIQKNQRKKHKKESQLQLGLFV